MESLLGKFYGRIRGSQEDIASEGLVHILQNSEFARKTIRKSIYAEYNIDIGELTFVSQNIGDKLERPDISGFDEDGNEVIIYEAKFWASLTDNQPIEYLNRLRNRNSLLVFICPELRKISLFDKLKQKLIESRIDQFEFHNWQYYFEDVFSSRFIIIKTWNEILNTIEGSLIEENNKILLSDLLQIRGFCQVIDSESFNPINPNELSPSIAKRIISYHDLVDKITDELIQKHQGDISGLKATPQRFGYTRFVKLRGFGLSIDVNFEYWFKKYETPFWLRVTEIENENKWVTNNKLYLLSKRVLLSHVVCEKDNRPYFPLNISTGKLEDEVIGDLVEQILVITDRLETAL